MHFIRRPVASLQIPNFQLPAIIIAGQPEIPPPLDTYPLHGTDLTDSALIWMSIDPDIYHFDAQVDDGSGNTELYRGYVWNGAVIKYGPVVPMGIRQEINYNGFTFGRWYEDGLAFRAVNTVSVSSDTEEVELFTFAPGGRVRANQRTIATQRRNIRGGSGTGTTVSASYAAMPGTPGMSITKEYNTGDTELVCRCNYSMLSTAATTDMRVGIRINGVNTEVIQFTSLSAGARFPLCGEAEVTGLAAGTYTAELVWRRASGAGTVTVSASDSFSLAIEEVATT